MWFLAAHSIHKNPGHSLVLTMTIKLKIYQDCAKAYDSGKVFAFALPEQVPALQTRCAELAEKQETNFVILRHNTSAQGSGLDSLNDPLTCN
jgi:hypothetical protein